MDTKVTYVWPPNWDGDLTLPVNRRWAVEMLGRETESQSDSYTANETNVRKIALSDMALPDGTAASKMVVEKITYNINGFTGVSLSWDRDPDNIIAYLQGSDMLDYTRRGGLVDTAEGGTGDVLLTTYGGSEDSTYHITVEFRLK